MDRIMLLYVVEHCHERSIVTPVRQTRNYLWCRFFNNCTAHFHICLSVNLSCGNLRMSQKITNVAQGNASLKHMHGLRVTEHMWRYFIRKRRIAFTNLVTVFFQNICYSGASEFLPTMIHKQRRITIFRTIQFCV